MLKKSFLKVFICLLFLGFGSGAQAAGAAPDQALATALQAYAKRTNDDVKTFEPRQAAFVDLNRDGHKDALVLLEGPYWCGSGGCTLLVFKGGKDSFTFISRSSLIRGPLLVSHSRTKCWRDLVVEVSVGGRPAKKVALKFNGRKYPLNPSVQKALLKNAAVQGETVFQP
jgi:putative lipoprotein